MIDDHYSEQACRASAQHCFHRDLVDGLAFRGHSPLIERLRLQIRRIAPHLRIALITGERGTGKQQVARALHSLSGKEVAAFRFLRSAAELHAVKVEHVGSRRTTCYLPKLSELTARDQAELLAAIHSIEAAQPAHQRQQLIFATEHDLRGLVAAGQFHGELYRKISSVEITLPPLRSRPEDIGEIVAALLKPQHGRSANASLCRTDGLLDGRALSRLKGYGWPGNLRELAQVIALARLHSRPGAGVIEAMHLPPLESAPTRSPYAAVEGEMETERLDHVIERHVLGVLMHCSGNKVRAAERLGISRSTLYRMLDANTLTSAVSHST